MSKAEAVNATEATASAFSIPHINTGASLRENIQKVIQLWIDMVGLVEPLLLPYTDPVTGEFFPGHESVQQFVDRLTAHRETANRAYWTGAVVTRRDPNPHQKTPDKQLAFVGEIPPLLYALMERGFGYDWQGNPEVWKEFKSLFQIGNLNPHPKVIR